MIDERAVDVEEINELIRQGDLVGAWRLLDTHTVGQSKLPGMPSATGRLLRLRGRHNEARVLLENTLVVTPDDTGVLVELARIALDAGEPDAAQGWYERAYLDQAHGEEWVLDWVELLCRLNRLDVAQRIAAKYCEHVPASARGWFCLGFAYQRSGLHDDALHAYERAMQLDNRVPMLRNNMSVAYIETGSYAQAQSILEHTLRDEPGNALAWTNLAAVLLRRGDPAAAQIAAERACVLAPDYTVALQTCSDVHKELQEWDRALALAHRALNLELGNASLAWSLAMLQLMLGHYAAGWSNHEARWDGSPELRNTLPNLPVPRWTGQSLAGRTLFIWSEQGYGSALQFVRFLPLIAGKVRQAGGKLVFCCFASLLTLVQRSLGDVVETIVAHDQPSSNWPAFDYHLPLASLPLILGVTLDQLPVMTSYLKADRAKDGVSPSQRAPEGRRIRVGLVWRGSSTHKRSQLRAVDPLTLATTFGRVRGIEFVSLQLDAGSDSQVMRDAGLQLTDRTEELRSFDDTALLLQSLDLMITVCTSVAHLAGALGVPTWVLLDVNPHWTWMTGRSDSPWYPSIRLYRQQEYGQWDPVLAQVARDLAALAGTEPPQLVQRAEA